MGSMQVCVMSASIIASIICGLAEAELVFFNHQLHMPPSQPKNCESAVQLSREVKAVGQTANAAALTEAFDERKVYNTIVMVTDEEENTKASLANGDRVLFAELFKRYRDEVAPECELVLVSFLEDAVSETQLMKELKAIGITSDVVSQFKFSQTRPDLTKIDAMLGLLSCDTVDFAEEVTLMASQIASAGIARWLEQEAEFVEQRTQAQKQTRIEGLVEQLRGLVTSEQLQALLNEE